VFCVWCGVLCMVWVVCGVCDVVYVWYICGVVWCDVCVCVLLAGCL